MKLSKPMQRLLKHLAKGGEPCELCHTMSEHGGMAGTIRALCARGLVCWATHYLTAKGRQAAFELVGFKDLGLDSRHCSHNYGHALLDGPRISTRYGSAPTKMCKTCGAYRNVLRPKNPGPWCKWPAYAELEDIVGDY